MPFPGRRQCPRRSDNQVGEARGVSCISSPDHRHGLGALHRRLISHRRVAASDPGPRRRLASGNLVRCSLAGWGWRSGGCTSGGLLPAARSRDSLHRVRCRKRSARSPGRGALSAWSPCWSRRRTRLGARGDAPRPGVDHGAATRPFYGRPRDLIQWLGWLFLRNPDACTAGGDQLEQPGPDPLPDLP